MRWYHLAFKHEDTLRLIASSACVLAALALGAFVSPSFALGAGVLVAFVLLFALGLDHARRAERDRMHQAQHLQHTQYLFSRLDLRATLAPLTGWSASPRLASVLYDLVRARTPEVIVELGSGASTIVMGYALEQNGRGRLLSLEHDAEYAEQTRRAVAQHGLTDRVEVVHAPLRSVELAEGTYRWYTFRPEWLREGERIGLLSVDGPPHKTQRQARFPAVPVLASFLADDAVVVLDDAGRVDEHAIAQAWQTRYEFALLDAIPDGKGIAVLQRQPLTQS